MELKIDAHGSLWRKLPRLGDEPGTFEMRWERVMCPNGHNSCNDTCVKFLESTGNYLMVCGEVTIFDSLIDERRKQE